MELDKTLRAYSQRLRKEASKEENTLWYQYLRKYPVQFRRQCVLEPYIADFYCAKARLVIELDGSQHFSPEGVRKDEIRTKHLESLGLKVLRFSNADVNQNLSGVCQLIDRAVKERFLDGPVPEGIGRRTYKQKEIFGGRIPSSAPFGGTFPPKGKVM